MFRLEVKYGIGSSRIWTYHFHDRRDARTAQQLLEDVFEYGEDFFLSTVIDEENPEREETDEIAEAHKQITKLPKTIRKA